MIYVIFIFFYAHTYYKITFSMCMCLYSYLVDIGQIQRDVL